MGIHPGQSAPSKTDLCGFQPIPTTVESPKFILNCMVRWLDFKGAFHMVNGCIHVALIFPDNTHADVGDKVFGNGG